VKAVNPGLVVPMPERAPPGSYDVHLIAKNFGNGRWGYDQTSVSACLGTPPPAIVRPDWGLPTALLAALFGIMLGRAMRARS
jgi:hypothetical protein